MIRKSTNNDLDKVMEIWLSASLQKHDFISASNWWQHQEQIRHDYLEVAEIWVMETAGEIEGFLALNGNNLTALFEHPDQEGLEIRDQLLQKAKELRSKLKLYIYAQDEDAQLFYTNNGFNTLKQQLEHTTKQTELVMQYTSNHSEHIQVA